MTLAEKIAHALDEDGPLPETAGTTAEDYAAYWREVAFVAVRVMERES